MDPVSPLNCTLDELSEQIDTFDVFICCASFEPRCLSVAKALLTGRAVPTYVGRFNQRPGRTDDHFQQLITLGGKNAFELGLDLSDPIASADSFYAVLHGIRESGATKVAVDVSTFTHECVLLLYRLISLEFRDSFSSVFLYNGAKDYSVGDGSEKKWLSRGIREVRSVIGYPGELLPSRSIHLILLAGFEIERAIGLIREFEPSHVSLGCGDRNVEFTKPHQPTNEQTIAAIQRVQSIASEVDVFAFNPYSPDEACAAVEAQWRKHKGMNAIVAPLNTKLSTLGVARFASEVEVAQVCYAQPLVYNVEKYSTPGNEVWVWMFPSLR